MNKLFAKFQELKQENSDTLYLLKNGIFYISLNKDAEKLSELFGFKITNLNDTVTKCGFPETKLDFYTNLLNTCNVDFEIIDVVQKKVKNVSNYLQQEKLNKILKSIEKLDMNQVSFQDAFYMLKDLNEKLKNFNEEIKE